jgi:hypothetical protein
MSNRLYEKVAEELCPNGNWQLSDTMGKLLSLQINKLPRSNVPEEEVRYPTNPAAMRAFLDTFFARHYFQVQNCLLDYLTSEDFIERLGTKNLSILDIGAGPAVASLAITDVVARVIRQLSGLGQISNSEIVKTKYILNDTANICLGTGQELIRNYFRMSPPEESKLFHAGTFTVGKEFPASVSQIRRICRNLGFYSIVVLSYVVNPLSEEQGFANTIRGLKEVEMMCNPAGRVLIVQDRFSESVIKKVARLMGESCQKDVLAQFVYSSKNSNDSYTYQYYYCLFEPSGRASGSAAVSA